MSSREEPRIRFADRGVARIDHADPVDDIHISICARFNGAGGHLPHAIGSFLEVRVRPRRRRDITAAQRHRTAVAIFGHAGDGHVHVNALPDTTRPEWREALAALYAAATDLLVELGGVPSGEHGVGRLRAGVLERFYGTEVMALFREVKRAYDPLGVFNPGVILPATDWAPLVDLKVGSDAAPIPNDIARRLRDTERNASWGVRKLDLANPGT